MYGGAYEGDLGDLEQWKVCKLPNTNLIMSWNVMQVRYELAEQKRYG